MKKFSKQIIAAVIVLNIAFTVAVLYLSYHDHAVPDSLTIAWYSFTTGELWLLATIKKQKIKNEVQPPDDQAS